MPEPAEFEAIEVSFKCSPILMCLKREQIPTLRSVYIVCVHCISYTVGTSVCRLLAQVVAHKPSLRKALCQHQWPTRLRSLMEPRAFFVELSTKAPGSA